MRPGGVLFLDLSTQIGWVYGHPADDAVPLWDVKKLPEGRDYGYIFNSVQNYIEDLLGEHQPAKVGIEDMIPQRNNNVHTARLTGGIHAIVDLVCFQNEIEAVRVHVSRMRAAVIGRAQLTPLEKAVRPRLSVKTQIVEPWCISRGWGAITSHDARDAAIGFAYLTGERAPRGKR